jgi:hypothetical protein
VSLAELQFDSAAGGRGGGGGGFGGRGAGAPGAPAPVAVGTYPRGYRVEVSTDGRKWSAPVAQGVGAAGPTSISFKPVTARFVRLTETGTDPATTAWTIQNLRLYAVGK